MKIEKKSVPNIIPFGDVLAGTVFKGATGMICMKLEAEYEELPRNAVNLNSGSLYLYDDKEEVEVLEDAVLTY